MVAVACMVLVTIFTVSTSAVLRARRYIEVARHNAADPANAVVELIAGQRHCAAFVVSFRGPTARPFMVTTASCLRDLIAGSPPIVVHWRHEIDQAGRVLSSPVARPAGDVLVLDVEHDVAVLDAEAWTEQVAVHLTLDPQPLGHVQGYRALELAAVGRLSRRVERSVAPPLWAARCSLHGVEQHRAEDPLWEDHRLPQGVDVAVLRCGSEVDADVVGGPLVDDVGFSTASSTTFWSSFWSPEQAPVVRGLVVSVRTSPAQGVELQVIEGRILDGILRRADERFRGRDELERRALAGQGVCAALAALEDTYLGLDAVSPPYEVMVPEDMAQVRAQTGALLRPSNSGVGPLDLLLGFARTETDFAVGRQRLSSRSWSPPQWQDAHQIARDLLTLALPVGGMAHCRDGASTGAVGRGGSARWVQVQRVWREGRHRLAATLRTSEDSVHTLHLATTDGRLLARLPSVGEVVRRPTEGDRVWWHSRDLQTDPASSGLNVSLHVSVIPTPSGAPQIYAATLRVRGQAEAVARRGPTAFPLCYESEFWGVQRGDRIMMWWDRPVPISLTQCGGALALNWSVPGFSLRRAGHGVALLGVREEVRDLGGAAGTGGTVASMATYPFWSVQLDTPPRTP